LIDILFVVLHTISSNHFEVSMTNLQLLLFSDYKWTFKEAEGQAKW